MLSDVLGSSVIMQNKPYFWDKRTHSFPVRLSRNKLNTLSARSRTSCVNRHTRSGLLHQNSRNTLKAKQTQLENVAETHSINLHLHHLPVTRRLYEGYVFGVSSIIRYHQCARTHAPLRKEAGGETQIHWLMVLGRKLFWRYAFSSLRRKKQCNDVSY